MSFERLQALGEEEKQRQAGYKRRIYCCTSTACLSTGSGETLQALEQAIAAAGAAEEEAEVVQTGCMALCSRGPLVRVAEQSADPVLYGLIDGELAHQIVRSHLPPEDPPPSEVEGSRPAEPHSRLSHRPGGRELQQHLVSLDSPFFTKQVKIVLNEVGQIDPERIEDYLAHGGYQALAKVLAEMTPEEVCDEILASGLRGRGGAGYPTGRKWHFAREQGSPRKYVIVNGDEGDPGAYMDRSVMEYNPHRVLEGMLICAYAVGASSGYLYIRGEYPIAIKRIRKALIDARHKGIMGRSVLGSEFNFTADIRIGAGAFVCGEETALIYSIEGKRGMPRMRPPYPSTSGLWNEPTVINNVETLASVPSIIRHGADWYAGIGTEESKGTKVFALVGQLQNSGLIEVPMGITLREIVFDIGGGVPNGREFKAVQTGGPSGGCIPAEYLDTPVDYESLTELGSIMGSGGLVILDDQTRMPDFARFFMDFCVDESCGKCLPCRVGTVQIRSRLDKIIDGQAGPDDLVKLESLCQVVKTSSLCGLGQSAPNPVLSTLNYFRAEYEELLEEGG